jgi:hypothetical protein
VVLEGRADHNKRARIFVGVTQKDGGPKVTCELPGPFRVIHVNEMRHVPRHGESLDQFETLKQALDVVREHVVVVRGCHGNRW